MKIKVWRKNIIFAKMTFFVFLTIFQPPILPISLIYVMGIVDCIIILAHRKKFSFIFRNSKMQRFAVFIMIMFFYLIIINMINVLFIEYENLLLNRLRCINQLVILTLIELLSISCILLKAEENNISIKEVMNIIISAGLLQGICTVVAYLIPEIRLLFVKFGDGNLWEISYVWERRGYGFSMTLLDTFGYGMGLLGGYAIFMRKDKPIFKWFSIVLITFSILMNARTGFIVLAIAVAIELVISNSKKSISIIKSLGGCIVLLFIVMYLVPFILQIGIQSENTTFSWAAKDMYELYIDLFREKLSNLENASYISNIDVLPTNVFEFLIGSGHSIYDTKKQLGFRSDVGIINSIWTYGILGTVLFEGFIGYLFIKGYKSCKTVYKKVILLNAIAYYIVQIKAILIGYNPGVCITYLTTFILLYFVSQNKIIDTIGG